MEKKTMKEFQQNSYLAGTNAAYIEELYEEYLKNPDSVDGEWHDYFQGLSQGGASPDISHEDIRAQFKTMARQPHVVSETAAVADKQGAVDLLIEAYRRFGHLNAKLDPLGSVPEPDPRLQIGHYGLTDADLAKTFTTKGVLSSPTATLQQILTALRDIYCGSVGVQYSTISDERERHWLREYVENKQTGIHYDADTKRSILKELIASETLEKYLDVRFIGQKRFSIEGGDSLIPLLDELAKRARAQSIEEIVIGMAHRGRLNVLLNIMGQSPKELFQEFEGKKDYGMTSGDVKYHRGYSRDVLTKAGPIHLALAFNPSHLEFICPVIMGSVRARQKRHNGLNHDYAMAVMIHGDAAFSGQGIVMETLNMSQTRAHYVGGSLHIILNNQIGFTMSNVADARSSHYCSDLAKMLDAPIFHVNADDPEAVVKVAQLALDYRMAFHKDIVIDLICYRRHGHQEVDEPTATQPLMYQIIKKHPTARQLYAKRLIAEGVCQQEEVDKWIDEYRDCLDAGEQVVETLDQGLSKHYHANWTPYIDQEWTAKADTRVPLNKLKELGEKLDPYPEHFKLQRQVGMICQARKKMTAGEQPLDWGYAEVMAYATLLDEGHPVRLVGEDSRRGTFFHRHSTLFNQVDGEEYMALKHLSKGQASIEIYDSLLSEAGALGFEYGYSTAEPNALVIWEAQFGDFANGAQVIIDQFISSGWQKWNRLSGLTLFLPHGFEGMGPEHSSARLERYLQLCAQYNMQVCVPTTPSQIFHLLRRQVLRPYRKPLVVITPKSLLRHKLATSTLNDLAEGEFQLLIPEVDNIDPAKVNRVVLCSGKVYYELLAKRREQNIEDIAIIRIEQLYPFPYEGLEQLLSTYKNAEKVIWCQEEPMNQGAWFITRHRLVRCLQEGQTLEYAGRKASAAPAVGYPALHRKQQETLVNQALNLNEENQ